MTSARTTANYMTEHWGSYSTVVGLNSPIDPSGESSPGHGDWELPSHFSSRSTTLPVSKSSRLIATSPRLMIFQLLFSA